MATKLSTRVAELEKLTENLGPLASAQEVEALRGVKMTGGVAHPWTWHKLGVEPGSSLVVSYAQGGELNHMTVTKDGVTFRFISGQNIIRCAWVVR